MEKHDIANADHIKNLVDLFYERVRKDELLAPIFNARITGGWEIHLQRMYSFWNTILLGEFQYQGNPFSVHADLPVDHSHFTRWLELFYGAVDELFSGEKADDAKLRAGKMAQIFELKIDDSRNKGLKSLM